MFHMCSRPSPGTAASPACSWCSGRWGFIAATALPISRASAAPQGPPPLSDYWRVFTVFNIWTVDLAYLLNKFSVSFSFFTVTLGANPQYSAESFYREQLQEDIDRVDELFGKALEAGISIQCRSISAYDIAFLLLSGHCIAIALVDKSKLNSSWMNDVQQLNEDSDYMGHYVVICGYDADDCEFEIRDPASSRKRERVKMKSLDEARKSFGTDEDILLVSLTGKSGMKVTRKFLAGSM
ncbi:hypothetical protein PVAP13_3KG227129 [Panicum virgatum]|uniref:Protein GUCD1 n=1 Tax=Panicum virgatum TaxID=38727 RepID=A0A8T0V4U9_PANVG|nr:hypothetical protein PVAP13_3KG227129 [Panicum virgatum]